MPDAELHDSLQVRTAPAVGVYSNLADYHSDVICMKLNFVGSPRRACDLVCS